MRNPLLYFVLLIACGLTLTGCANILAQRAKSCLDTGLASLRGKPAKSAFGIIGYPNSEGKVADEKFYLWSNASTTWVPSSSSTSATGMVGGAPFNYNQTTIGGSGETIHHSCAIRIFVNEKGTVEHSDYQGNLIGCEPYALKFDPLCYHHD